MTSPIVIPPILRPALDPASVDPPELRLTLHLSGCFCFYFRRAKLEADWLTLLDAVPLRCCCCNREGSYPPAVRFSKVTAIYPARCE